MPKKGGKSTNGQTQLELSKEHCNGFSMQSYKMVTAQ